MEKLNYLSEQTTFEADGEPPRSSPAPACFSPKACPDGSSFAHRVERKKNHAFTHPAQMPNGKNIVLLKTLLSSACERDCYYCPLRAGRDFRRATFKPDEFASLFAKLTAYGFDLEDLPFTTNENNLPLHADPKQAWAQINLIERPIEINKGDKHHKKSQ